MCEHYKRNCSIISPCCDKQYNCRLCHDINEYDNNSDPKKMHKINRFEIKEIVCNICKIRQNISNKCINCNIKFGKYYCSICNYFDDDISKKQFHCDKCGICRVGGKENFFHCDTCEMCLNIAAKDNHVCREKKSHTNCPICLEYLFDSRDSIITLNCGHVIHQNCLNDYIKTNYKCPICNKSLVNVNQYIEQQVNNTLMPEELRVDTNIICNDCNKKSIAKFHIVAMKCIHCESFNTKRI